MDAVVSQKATDVLTKAGKSIESAMAKYREGKEIMAPLMKRMHDEGHFSDAILVGDSFLEFNQAMQIMLQAHREVVKQLVDLLIDTP